MWPYSVVEPLFQKKALAPLTKKCGTTTTTKKTTTTRQCARVCVCGGFWFWIWVCFSTCDPIPISDVCCKKKKRVVYVQRPAVFFFVLFCFPRSLYFFSSFVLFFKLITSVATTATTLPLPKHIFGTTKWPTESDGSQHDLEKEEMYLLFSPCALIFT